MACAVLELKRESNEEEPTLLDDFLIRIEPGIYEAQCVRHEKAVCFGNEKKILLVWKILSGKYGGTELEQWFKFYENPGRTSKYLRNWILATGGRRPIKRTRMSRSIFQNVVCRVKVRYTKRKYPDGRLYADCLQYSVVDEIIEPIVTGVSR